MRYVYTILDSTIIAYSYFRRSYSYSRSRKNDDDREAAATLTFALPLLPRRQGARSHGRPEHEAQEQQQAGALAGQAPLICLRLGACYCS